MKKLILSMAVAAFILSSCANKTEETNEAATGATETVMPEATEATSELKDHVCTEACKEAGECVYVHSEKGHVCTDACKTE